MGRPRFRQHGYLPSQQLVQRPPKKVRIAGYDVLEHVAPAMHGPLTTALRAFQEGKLGDALHWFGECAKIDPTNKAVLYFGSEAAQRAYFTLKLADPAPPQRYLETWRKAALDLSEALTDAHPESVVIHNLGRFIQDDGDDAGSIPLYERALKIKRDQVESWGNMGTALLRVGRRQEAETAWNKCVAFPAENASGHMAQAYIWLRRGEWARGWKALNMRWRDRTFTESYGRKDLKGVPWTGEPLKQTDSVLLHGEQGLGDHVMFARYIPALQKRGITIAALETRAALKGWFDACWLGFPVIIREQDPLPAYTHHVPLMSLPGILGLDGVPAPIAPTIPEVQRSGVTRIGLAWKGARGNVMDGQRSLPEECLAVLGEVPNVEWVPLQHDKDGVDALTAQVWIGDNVKPATPFNDVLGLAEVMRSCDHILCVDTLHAHVAGSLGVPSTVLHRYHREWRWGLDSEETPWYPNQMLITCPTPDDWSGALRDAVQRLSLRARQNATLDVSTPGNVSNENELTARAEAASPIVIISGRHGEFHVNPLDEYVGRSLIEYGEFSKGEADLFADLVKPTWRVIEVGANIGAHTKQLTQLAHLVIAYEPNPDNAALLRLNAPNATVIEAAVGREAGTTTIDAPNQRLPGNFGGLHVGVGTHVVPMVWMTGPADFVKLDCEGVELDCLQGAPLLMACQPIIYAEADHRSTAEPLIDWLHAQGYQVWWHVPTLYHPDNFRRNLVNHFGAIASVNVLAVPKDQACPVSILKHRLMPVLTTKVLLPD